ncbi:MAG: rRNA maturation RNase YbeY [Clostridia bacterium]|nr:rRNA maturation RNase YbeY [Clostridia bacterium]
MGVVNKSKRKSVLTYGNVGAGAYPADFFENIYFCALKELDLPNDFIVELEFVTSDFIRSVNEEHRGVDSVTDVLSFPSVDFKFPYNKLDYTPSFDFYRGKIMLGSILICRDRAQEQADEYGHSLDREMGFLFAHGLMHLFGYDHIEQADEKIMINRVEGTLEKAGLKR